MPAAASASGNVSRLNFGLRLERDSVRTSTTRVILFQPGYSVPATCQPGPGDFIQP